MQCGCFKPFFVLLGSSFSLLEIRVVISCDTDSSLTTLFGELSNNVGKDDQIKRVRRDASTECMVKWQTHLNYIRKRNE